jgi:hypothetical protein
MVTETPNAPDPILAAIAAQRDAYAVLVATGGKGLSDPENVAAYQAETKFCDVLLTTKPTTITGAAALLRYMLKHNEDERGCLFEPWERELRVFLETLAGGLEALAR